VYGLVGGTEALATSGSSGIFPGSVDGWPLATAATEAHGGSAAASNRPRVLIWRRRPSTRGVHAECSGGRLTRRSLGGPPLGELGGGNWMVGMCADAPSADVPTRRVRFGYPQPLVTLRSPLAGGAPPARDPRAASGIRIVTWLILPVVICLSQRLSHACLSISNYTVKLRMAH
jgi:hypothetical protein